MGPSRRVRACSSFDIGRDLDDPDRFIATEVFEDRAALERQEALPEVAAVMVAFETALVAEPEATVLTVSGSSPTTAESAFEAGPILVP